MSAANSRSRRTRLDRYHKPMPIAVPEESTEWDSYIRRDPDVRLMLAVRAGNTDAFEKLVHKYQDHLVRVLTQLVKRRLPAEDLAQDVFLRVYQARKKYRPKAKFATWLFTIANNVARNAVRQQARRIQAYTGHRYDEGHLLLDDSLLAKSDLTPLRCLEREEVRRVVQRAVASLRERQRMVLLLSVFENWNHCEVAVALSLSRSAVKSLALRARASLRTTLEPYVRDGLL
jgi:RNA polymerase sigma-70 factor (ECF subfamily)